MLTIFNMSTVQGNGDLGTDQPKLKPLDSILTYCDTKERMHKLATEDYRMNKAMKGLIHNEFHKELVTVEMWMNGENDTWAILFFYKEKDLACIVGGNRAELFVPGSGGNDI